ncbi:MAG: Nif3-like dinuclear metal center hexameric protein [Candidatus Omnitrophota bacterium]
MIVQSILNQFLANLYRYGDFSDYCENGLQIEGKRHIERIRFGVSLNLPFIEKAIDQKADAVIVHHGIFQQGVFKLRGTLRHTVKMLLDNDISLYGIHLPMDAHPDMGHSAVLLKKIGAKNIMPFEKFGTRGENTNNYTLDHLLDLFHQFLHPSHPEPPSPGVQGEPVPFSFFPLSSRHGFQVLRNGPEIPRTVVIMSGGSSGYYEQAVEQGADTFIGGDIKEKIPALSYETHTNFINLGHYFSEKPGILALMKLISESFGVDTEYIEIPNPI